MIDFRKILLVAALCATTVFGSVSYSIAEEVTVPTVPQCNASSISKYGKALTNHASGEYKVLKPDLSQYLVDGAYYALCFTAIKDNEKPILIENTLGLPLLIDGLKNNVTTDTSHPLLTISGSSPVIVRNSSIMGFNSPGSLGLLIEDNEVLIEQSSVLQVEQGVVISGDQPVTLSENTIQAPEVGGVTGLKIQGDHVVVQAGTISNFKYGVMTVGSNNAVTGTNVVLNNDVDYSTGVFVRGGENNVLNDVSVHYYDQGVVIQGENNSVIAGNVVGKEKGEEKEWPSRIGVALAGKNAVAENIIVSHVQTGVAVKPFEGIAMDGGSIVDAATGIDVLPPRTQGEITKAGALEQEGQPHVNMSIIPSFLEDVSTLFTTAKPIPEDLNGTPAIALECSAHNEDGSCAVESFIHAVEGILPPLYCLEDNDLPKLAVNLYSWDHVLDVEDLYVHASVCSFKYISEPTSYKLPNFDVITAPINTCVFRCDNGLDGNPLQIPESKDLVVFFQRGEAMAYYDINGEVALTTKPLYVPSPAVHVGADTELAAVSEASAVTGGEAVIIQESIPNTLMPIHDGIEVASLPETNTEPPSEIDESSSTTATAMTGPTPIVGPGSVSTSAGVVSGCSLIIPRLHERVRH